MGIVEWKPTCVLPVYISNLSSQFKWSFESIYGLCHGLITDKANKISKFSTNYVVRRTRRETLSLLCPLRLSYPVGVPDRVCGSPPSQDEGCKVK